MSTTITLTAPVALNEQEVDFQRRIKDWTLERLAQFLAVKDRDLALFGGSSFAVRALQFEIASR